MILEPIVPTVLSVRRLPNADPAMIRAYGGDPERHRSLGLVTVDQDDPTYVALDEATKHAPVDVIFAKSFYAGAAHASGRLSGEILGVLGASEPEAIEHALEALLRCLQHDACFYDADGKRTVTVFPHVIASLGEYLSKEAGLSPGEPMAYLVAPPIEASIALDAHSGSRWKCTSPLPSPGWCPKYSDQSAAYVTFASGSTVFTSAASAASAATNG